MTIDDSPFRSVLLVAVGGAAGTTARYLLGEAIADVEGLPIGILIVNVSGAFVLGWLITALLRIGPDALAGRQVRLLVGTGVLGGFTTYSALANETAALLRDRAAWVGPAYGLGTVLFGGIATLAGIALGRRLPAAPGAHP